MDGDLLLCGSCVLQFSDIKHFILHKAEHVRSVYACELCVKTFSSQPALLFHYRSVHRLQTWGQHNGTCPEPLPPTGSSQREEPPVSPSPPSKALLCQLCHERCPTQDALCAHVREKHRDPQLEGRAMKRREEEEEELAARDGVDSPDGHSNSSGFFCKCCGCEFETQAQVAAHRRTHRGKLYKCPQCDFRSSVNSMIHLHRQEHRAGTVSCVICNWAYPDRATLSKHMCVHDTERPYVCCYESCAWRFKTEMMLRAHIQAHTTHGKFECSACGYNFRRRHHLKRHQIQMHGIGPSRAPSQATQNQRPGRRRPTKGREELQAAEGDIRDTADAPESKALLHARNVQLIIKNEEPEGYLPDSLISD
ncbi:hypothetical protein FKM82_003680 [Ascaphus truei]